MRIPTSTHPQFRRLAEPGQVAVACCYSPAYSEFTIRTMTLLRMPNSTHSRFRQLAEPTRVAAACCYSPRTLHDDVKLCAVTLSGECTARQNKRVGLSFNNVLLRQRANAARQHRRRPPGSRSHSFANPPKELLTCTQRARRASSEAPLQRCTPR